MGKNRKLIVCSCFKGPLIGRRCLSANICMMMALMRGSFCKGRSMDGGGLSGKMGIFMRGSGKVILNQG